MLDQISYEIANSRESLWQSYRLVYDRYLEKGFCKENSSHLYFGLHDFLPETRTFVAIYNDEVIATLSVVPDSALGLPSDHLFAHQLNNYRHKNAKIAEVSRFAVNAKYQHLSLIVFSHLFQLLYHSYVISSDITDCIILVEPQNCPLYKKLGFVEHGQIKFDEEASNTSSQLMVLPMRETNQLVPHKRFDTTQKSFQKIRCFLSEILQKQKKIASFSAKLVAKNMPLNNDEYRMLNFKNYLLKSYSSNNHSNQKIKNLVNSFDSIQSLFRWMAGKQISAYNSQTFLFADQKEFNEVS